MSVVDVIVPCYNYAHFLEECVESILSQSHRNLRVLIINDASPDNTDEVAQELLRRDSRVQYLRHQENRGNIATFNEGLDWATGEYTLLLSADDMLTPGSLARSVQLMDAHREVVLTHGKVIAIEPNGQETEWEEIQARETMVVSGFEFIRSLCERGGNLVQTPTVVVRTDVQRRIGGYRADLPHSADLEMWLRFGAHGRVGYVPANQAYYRLHGSNMHYNYQSSLDLEQQRSAFLGLFDAHGDIIPNAAKLRDLAMGRMAGKAFWSAYHAFDRHQDKLCGDLLDFATATDPRIKTWRSHRRMRCKLLLGSRWWSRLRAILDLAAPRKAREAVGASDPESSADARRRPTWTGSPESCEASFEGSLSPRGGLR